jgi:hypothetical protein
VWAKEKEEHAVRCELDSEKVAFPFQIREEMNTVNEQKIGV